MTSRNILVAALAVFVVLLMYYSPENSGMIGHVRMLQLDEEVHLHTHNKFRKMRMGRIKHREMDVVEGFNSDPLPNRTILRSADMMCAENSDFFCIPPLRRFEAEFRVAPKYKVSTCVVQKSMSTVMTAIFCYLFDEDTFLREGRVLLKEKKRTRFCADRNEARSLRSMRWFFNVKEEDGWIHTMVIRDPVDRFLSGFVDKCIRAPLYGLYCDGCKANMTCFLIKEYERMVSEVKKGRFTRTYEDRHFFPQNWRCELSKKTTFIQFIRYSSNATDTLINDLFKILVRQKVENSTLEFIRNELVSGRTPHSTVESPARSFLEKRLRSSEFLMEYIVRMFYYDFEILNYDFPDGFQ